MIDVIVRRTDAGCEPHIFHRRRREDRGTHLLKLRAAIAALTFAAAESAICFRAS
jgi:hypothetical protein